MAAAYLKFGALSLKAILESPPLPKVMLSILDCGIIKLLSFINISSKRGRIHAY